MIWMGSGTGPQAEMRARPAGASCACPGESAKVIAVRASHGVGEALNLAALAEAKHRGARTVDLTSRPSREAANRLYQRLGFVLRDTNVYRLSL